MGKNKKFLLVLSGICLIFLVGGIAAAWVIGYDKIVVGEIYSNSNPINVTVEFVNFSINTTSGAAINNQTTDIINSGNSTTVDVKLNVTKINLDGSCPNYENDCSTILVRDGIQWEDGNNYTLQTGSNPFALTTSCVQNSCDQNITVDLSIQEI